MKRTGVCAVPIGVASAILLIVRVGFADVQNILLALCFNGIGLPAAATGLLDPIWAMLAIAVSVTAIFINSLWAGLRSSMPSSASAGHR
jgi:cation transport ATPase